MAEVKLDDIKGSNSDVVKKAKTIISDKEKPKVKPVVNKSDIVSTHKSLGEKFADTFMNETVDDVKSWLIADVVVPGIKNTILDMLGMMFFGGGDYSRRDRSRGYDRERVSYNSYYSSGRRESRSSRDRRDRDDGPRRDGKIDYRNIIFRDRRSAEALVDELHRRIEVYEQVSIAEMFDLMEITGKYTDNNWGWTRKSDIGIRRVSNGYLIDVAEAEALE